MNDFDRLLQKDNIDKLSDDLPLMELIPVFIKTKDTHKDYILYPALVPVDEKSNVLVSSAWDLSVGGGMPVTFSVEENGVRSKQYIRCEEDHNVEPLIFYRSFSKLKPEYYEISEEFRLFHNLYFDKKTGKYIKINSSGKEELIAEITDHTIFIRLKEIREYLTARKMYLSLQMDYREYSSSLLKELGLKQTVDENNEGGEDHTCQHKQDDLFCYDITFGNSRISPEQKSFSCLYAKKLIPPFSPENIKTLSMQSQKYADFIIGQTNDGELKEHTSNPNLFGKNPGAPRFLTPVHFEKQVLDKYYHQPQKYSVEPSVLRCGTQWLLQIDNHHTDKVCVWLGDLGSIPYEEQLHWKSCNISPTGGLSQSYIDQQLHVKFSGPTQTEHKLQSEYSQLIANCDKYLKWQILIPLAEGDKYHLETIRIPATEEQSAFDAQILSLAKVMIDSINSAELVKILNKHGITNLDKSLAQLEKALELWGLADSSTHIRFLRDLQSLRSSGTAHRKGSNYKKIASTFEMDEKPLTHVLETIMGKTHKFLAFLNNNLENGNIKGS
ncbi:MAG: hypothetical protein RR373_08970 [Akkermansia sp.]